jgi:hypothetical protein
VSAHPASHACYSRGCRDAACRQAHAVYERDRKRERTRPDGTGVRYALVDATECRQHLLWLASKGVGIKQAMKVSGVAASTLKNIRRGKTVAVRSTTANEILGIHLGLVERNEHGKHPHHQPHYKGLAHAS